MTKQEEIALLAVASGLVAKFYFKQDWKTSAFFGLGAVSIYAILTANNS